MRETAKVAANKIILGTMRLGEKERTVTEWVRFFETVYERGIRTLHSSSEYDSYPLLLEVLAKLLRDSPAVRFRHIVKLANPSFDDIGFDSVRLASAIADYKYALKSDKIDDVQWMWRQDLTDDAKRQSAFCDAAVQFADATAKLKLSGEIGRFLCFPYSESFASVAVEQDFVDGLVVYRNVQETEFDALLDTTYQRDKMAVIIRPFNGGKLLSEKNESALDRLSFALSKPAIESAIISSGSLDHIDALIDC